MPANNTTLRIDIRDGSLAGQKREISMGAITIGRNADSGLQFHPLTDRVVSGRHAVIQAEADGYYLIDQKSTNGTFVNGARVSRDRLKNGDMVQFGTQGPHAIITIIEREPRPAALPVSHAPAMPDPSMLHAVQFANEPDLAELPIENNFRKSFANIGLYNPDKPAVEKKTGKHIGIAITLIVAVFLSLLVISLVKEEMGIVIGTMAAILAFVPACFYVLPLLWLDRYDPEPPWALAGAFAWGALVSIVVSLVINSTVMVIFGEAAGMLISAPIFEEASKGFGVLLVLVLLRREFDDIVDGIVYAGIIALGFATVENVFYYGREFIEHGQAGLQATFFARGILSPFAHVIFTSMTGIGCGIARESHKWAVRIVMPIVGYFVAVTLHAIWNTLASGDAFIIGYIVFEIPFFLLFVAFLFYIARRERKILHEMLSAEVAMGLISENQLKTVTSSLKSLGWILSGVGIGKAGKRRKFLRALAKLGLSYWHIQRATVAHGVTRSFSLSPILRSEVKKLREQI
jgi:RsiW-degrading membrane proteinase PrsW (M82 family)